MFSTYTNFFSLMTSSVPAERFSFSTQMNTNPYGASSSNGIFATSAVVTSPLSGLASIAHGALQCTASPSVPSEAGSASAEAE